MLGTLKKFEAYGNAGAAAARENIAAVLEDRSSARVSIWGRQLAHPPPPPLWNELVARTIREGCTRQVRSKNCVSH